jgi:hypothetical protein
MERRCDRVNRGQDVRLAAPERRESKRRQTLLQRTEVTVPERQIVQKVASARPPDRICGLKAGVEAFFLRDQLSAEAIDLRGELLDGS